MTLTATCPRCGVTLHAVGEDELVANVQHHVRNDHGFEHELPRKHVLAYLRKTGTSDAPAIPKVEVNPRRVHTQPDGKVGYTLY